MQIRSRHLVGLALLAALLGAAGLAQAQQQQEEGRVVSSTPIRDSNGRTAYSVTYEYAGRQYTTRMDQPPGRTIALQVSPLGVTTSPVPEPPQIVDNGGGSNNNGAAPWDDVEPEQGVVVGAGGPPAVAYGAPVYAPPVYAPAYGYDAPFYYGPPVALSLGIGYSRGWGGYRGGYHGGYRGGWGGGGRGWGGRR